MTHKVHESTKVIPEYLQLLDNAPKTVDELVKFNEEHADLELPEGKAAVRVLNLVYESLTDTIRLPQSGPAS